tara:strand:- start:7454 stop:7645 length:192 start_codon:yes stop_codon:yes gene_type:complete
MKDELTDLNELIETAEALIDMGDKDSPRVKLVKDSLWQVNYYNEHLKDNIEKLAYLTLSKRAK